jgi:hypothetical protein
MIPKNYMSSFFLLFFFSSWHLQPKYKPKYNQNGIYQVAVKKTMPLYIIIKPFKLITKLPGKYLKTADEGMTNGPPIFAYLVFGPGEGSLERLLRPIKAAV